jgi:hypothetical protein
MKSFLTILLLSFYTLSSVGASVSTHYCMGKVRKCQCNKAQEVSNKVHCCKDTIKFVKAQDVHAPQFAPDQKKQSHSTSVELLNYGITEDHFSANLFSYRKRYIIRSSDPPIYKLICHYRI